MTAGADKLMTANKKCQIDICFHFHIVIVRFKYNIKADKYLLFIKADLNRNFYHHRLAKNKIIWR